MVPEGGSSEPPEPPLNPPLTLALYVYLPVLSNDFFSIDAMVSVFKRGLAVFTLHENASMGCFSTASKSKCNLHIRAPFAGSYFFLLEFGLNV